MNNQLFNAEIAEKALIEYISTGVYSERAKCKANKAAAQEALRHIVYEFGQKRTIYEIDGQTIIQNL